MKRPELGVLCMNDAHSRQLLKGAAEALGAASASHLNQQLLEGVVVASVAQGSGAAQAGIR